MEEVEKFFTCPYCLEKISMLLDTSIEEQQSYIEDCEACCNPIQISYLSRNLEIENFQAAKA